MMAELKPCPFCGCKAKYVYSMPYNGVQCTKCKAWGKTIVDSYEQQDGKNEAIEAWNRRYTDAE
jgi:Lar family restriction alleviation protein